jgi:hypothetical protein
MQEPNPTTTAGSGRESEQLPVAGKVGAAAKSEQLHGHRPHVSTSATPRIQIGAASRSREGRGSPLWCGAALPPEAADRAGLSAPPPGGRGARWLASPLPGPSHGVPGSTGSRNGNENVLRRFSINDEYIASARPKLI